jgi:hypothetical protein
MKIRHDTLEVRFYILVGKTCNKFLDILDEEEQSKKSFGSEEVDVSVFIDVEKDITLTFGVYNFSYIINFNWLESIHFIILQSRGILHAQKNPQVGKIKKKKGLVSTLNHHRSPVSLTLLHGASPV